MKYRTWGLLGLLAGVLLLFSASAAVAQDADQIYRDCSECHSDIVDEINRRGGPHQAQLACGDCHLVHPEGERKAEFTACTDCHEPHGPSMAAGDCQSCHPAHQPLPIRYGAGVSRDWCAACHPDTVATFEKQGAAHDARVGCFRCHRAHPPRPESTPTGCTDCHKPEKNRHFELADCRACHQPHAPHERGQVSDDQLAQACFSCHPEVEEPIALAAQSHGSMTCGECHQRHLFSLLCKDCHVPHAETMTQMDCLRCHGPHNPGAIRFEDSVAAELCATCHDSAVQTLAERGGAHGEGLGCTDCHGSHPPREGAIPSCVNCHAGEDQPHYALPDCLSCHIPHAPLETSWDAMPNLADACLSCHDDPMEPLEGFASPHQELGCGTCHQSHEAALGCLDCHEGHGEATTAQDCGTCHDAHTPRAIAFNGTPGRAMCAACHPQATTQVGEHGSAHRESLACSDCHQQHPAAGCLECHGTHPQKLLARAPACVECHQPAERAHFAVGNCHLCHPPHQPLQLTLESIDPVMPACLSCHDQVGRVFAASSTAHRRMDCLACHPSHGESSSCDQCHAPHGPDMKADACGACHAPHAPRPVAYDQNVAAALCAACHGEAAQTLAAKGAAHREKISCGACHPTHMPQAEQTALPCRDCHSRLKKRHYTLEPCLPCHAPHAPLEVNLASQEVVRPVCVSCHSVVGRRIDYHPSAHGEMDCRACHDGHQGKKLCLDCHQPHGSEMAQEDCRQCHDAHAPREVEYGRDIPNAFCAACHPQPSQLLQSRGLGHQNKLTCIACHPEHPPEGEKRVVGCTECHDPGDAAHFAVADCTGCHPGHAPRDLDFANAGDTRAACLSCHPEPGRAMTDAGSAHNRVDCGECHTSHREIQDCTGCHDPHTDDMTATDCQRCHEAHLPARVNLADDLPGGFCRGCHEEAASTLAKSATGHSGLACLRCHAGEHGRATACDTCHGWPHEAALHQKYSDCRTCHGKAHDLAEWQPQ